MKYIGYYDSPGNSSRKRDVVLAATNKMKYIADALNHKGISVEFISAAGNKDALFSKGMRMSDGDMQTIRFFSSIGRKSRITKRLSTFWIKLQLFLYLLFTVKKNEPILVYHAVPYMTGIRLIHRIKHCKLILEVEEIFGDVKNNPQLSRKEISFAKEADAYLFPTELLDDLINTSHKPSVLIHGTYQVEADRGCNAFANKLRNCVAPEIHCVYAGTFDPRKGGALAAVAAAEFLPENYHMHILGFGNASETKQTTDMIAQVAEKSKAALTYDGLLFGEDYICFIQSCDIGLSTQNPEAAFNATSFPSKILSYLANGLQVVSIRIPVVENSAIANEVSFYDKQTPEEIAKAILCVDLEKKQNARQRIRQLAELFENEFVDVLERLS